MYYNNMDFKRGRIRKEEKLVYAVATEKIIYKSV